MNGTVLVVDDEKNLTLVIQAMLEKEGFGTLVFNDGAQALEALRKTQVDAVVTDLKMPGVDGMQILETCRSEFPQLPVVMITAFGTVESAVSALKHGAFDFITKPFDQSELLNVVRKAVTTSQRSRREPSMTPPISKLVGESSQMRDVFKMIAKIADSSSTVLIQGESGTGKELVAAEIHRLSSRASGPFIKINCAAIPATLIESELFGYEKGAFTGAMTSKPGRFELANGGTLFLDEIAETPLEMQVKLLRALQEQEFERVGGISPVRVDVRIVTATNKDLEAEVKAGRFRDDLFYRLNVVPLRLPSLRERPEDIELLAHHFLERFSVKQGKPAFRLDPLAMQALKTYSWPGNIRQLENAIERMVVMGEGEKLTARDLPKEVLDQVHPSGSPHAEESTDALNLKTLVKKQTQELERDVIEKTLEETQGNVTRAAERLGFSRKGLQLKMKELGISRRVSD